MNNPAFISLRRRCLRSLDGPSLREGYEQARGALHVNRGPNGARREVSFHPDMARFYHRFDTPGHSPPINAGVYAGIGLKPAPAIVATAISRAVCR